MLKYSFLIQIQTRFNCIINLNHFFNCHFAYFFDYTFFNVNCSYLITKNNTCFAKPKITCAYYNFSRILFIRKRASYWRNYCRRTVYISNIILNYKARPGFALLGSFCRIQLRQDNVSAFNIHSRYLFASLSTDSQSLLISLCNLAYF